MVSLYRYNLFEKTAKVKGVHTGANDGVLSCMNIYFGFSDEVNINSKYLHRMNNFYNIEFKIRMFNVV